MFFVGYHDRAFDCLMFGNMDIFRDSSFGASTSFFPESKEVDFLSVLGEKTNLSQVVSKILGYCNGSDLDNIARVCRSWHRLCLQDKASALKMKKYIAKRKMMKENEHVTSISSETNYSSIQNRNESTPKKRRPLACWNENFNLTNMKQTPSSPPTSPRRLRFDKYVKEAKKLGKTGRLTPCPQCTLPSKVNEEEGSGQCTQLNCSFHFCLKCQCSYHKETACKYFITSSPSSSPSKVIHHLIGSRQSRKALRRL